MFARERPKDTRDRAKNHLEKYGWTYRAAAKELGCCYQHLSDVLNDNRQSRSLLLRVFTLGQAPKETPKN